MPSLRLDALRHLGPFGAVDHLEDELPAALRHHRLLGHHERVVAPREHDARCGRTCRGAARRRRLSSRARTSSERPLASTSGSIASTLAAKRRPGSASSVTSTPLAGLHAVRKRSGRRKSTYTDDDVLESDDVGAVLHVVAEADVADAGDAVERREDLHARELRARQRRPAPAATSRLAALSSTARWLTKFCATSSWLRCGWPARCRPAASACCSCACCSWSSSCTSSWPRFTALAVDEAELRRCARPPRGAASRPGASAASRRPVASSSSARDLDARHLDGDRRRPAAAPARRRRRRPLCGRSPLAPCRLFWNHQAAARPRRCRPRRPRCAASFIVHPDTVASCPTDARPPAARATALGRPGSSGCACSHAAIGQRIGALVARVAGMALDPAPLDLVQRLRSASSRCHSSTFFTGFLSAVLQPAAFQPRIHSVMPLRTYSLSV